MGQVPNSGYFPKASDMKWMLLLGIVVSVVIVLMVNQPPEKKTEEVVPYPYPSEENTNWRDQLPESVGQQQVHTTMAKEDADIPLPKASVDLTTKSIKILEGGDRKLNRWFSATWKPCSITKDEDVIKFSEPLSVIFHATAKGKGIHFDSLEAVEYVNEKKFVLHLKRYGKMPWSIK